MEERKDRSIRHVTVADSGVLEAARLVLALAAPVLAENFLAMFVGWSDSILTGRILAEERYLAAIGACGYLLWLLESFAVLISAGCQAIVSRLTGAGDHKQANHFVVQALLMALALGTAMRFGVVLSAEPIIGALNLEPDAAQPAVVYLQIVANGCPFMMVLLTGISCLRAAGHVSAGMMIMTMVNVVNIFASWTLTIGVGPWQGMGWRGVATGTTLSFILGGVVAVCWLFRGYGTIRIPLAVPRVDWQSCRRILRIGVPGAINSVGMVVCHLWFIAIIGRLGSTAMAAHIVAIRCESLGWLTADAFAIAAATLVGQSLGAGRVDLARLYGWLAFAMGAAAMSMLGVLFFTAAELMFVLFVDPSQTEVIGQGTPVLRLVSFAMPALAATMILTGAMRGAGDTRWPLLYNSVGLLAIRIPLAYLLTLTFPMGLFGAWLAMFADLYARAFAAAWRFLAAGWTRIEV